MNFRSWKMLSVWVVALSCLFGCRRQDIRTVSILVPDLRNAACEKVVLDVLHRTDGVLAHKVVFSPGQVTVTYDSMKLGLKNLEGVIADAGFSANDTPADPKARAALPPACLE